MASATNEGVCLPLTVLLQCLALQADVTNEASIEKAVKDAVAEFGRIDYAA